MDEVGDVWPNAEPGEPEGETYIDSICAICGTAIEIPLGPTIVADQCSVCETWFWIRDPDDNLNTVYDLLEDHSVSAGRMVDTKQADQYLADLAKQANYLKVRDPRFDQTDLIAEYDEQDWMLGYVCFVKFDPDPPETIWR